MWSNEMRAEMRQKSCAWVCYHRETLTRAQGRLYKDVHYVVVYGVDNWRHPSVHDQEREIKNVVDVPSGILCSS